MSSQDEKGGGHFRVLHKEGKRRCRDCHRERRPNKADEYRPALFLGLAAVVAGRRALNACPDSAVKLQTMRRAEAVHINQFA